ncbi:MAG: hypothetical protein ACPGUE_12025 [Marinomonas sp.]
MARSTTTITKENRDKIPPRGRNNRTLILEAIKEESMIGLNKDSTREESEKAFFKHVATRAFNPEDNNSGMCLTLLANKGWANIKPSNEVVNFDFDDNDPPHIQASKVMKAASDGLIAPDIANTFIQSIKAMIDIEEYTSLKERIEKLEKALAGDS